MDVENDAKMNNNQSNPQSKGGPLQEEAKSIHQE